MRVCTGSAPPAPCAMIWRSPAKPPAASGPGWLDGTGGGEAWVIGGAAGRLAALIQRDEGLILGADVLGAGADEGGLFVLLDDVGGPARHARDGEDAGVELGGDAQVVQQRGRE